MPFHKAAGIAGNWCAEAFAHARVEGRDARRRRLGGDWRFHLCSDAIVRHSDFVRLHRIVYGPFWALPGGRVKIGEMAEAAVKREMREELGADVRVVGLNGENTPGTRLLFKWFHVSKISSLDLRPSFLRDFLTRDAGAEALHIVHDDRK